MVITWPLIIRYNKYNPEGPTKLKLISLTLSKSSSKTSWPSELTTVNEPVNAFSKEIKSWPEVGLGKMLTEEDLSSFIPIIIIGLTNDLRLS